MRSCNDDGYVNNNNLNIITVIHGTNFQCRKVALHKWPTLNRPLSNVEKQRCYAIIAITIATPSCNVAQST